MNGIISITLVFVFVLSFVSFFTLNYIFPVEENSSLENHLFFKSSLKSEKPIFLLGHSLVAQLNITKINDIITKEHDDIIVYNLGFNHDDPTNRLSHLEELIKLKPKHVFYGIYYKDFFNMIYEHSEKTSLGNENILPNPKINFNKFIDKTNQEFGPFNSKITILKGIRTAFSFTGFFPDTTYNKIYLENAPFSYFAKFQTIIATNNETLEKFESFKDIRQIKINDESKIRDFKKIIKKFKENNISIIIFLAPLHPTFLSNIQPDENEKFEKLISDIQEEFNVEVYDFRYNYMNLPIWLDASHVAFNKNSMIYSEDIANMILSEIP